MNSPTLITAVPVLASLDIAKTIQFYCQTFGFTKVYEEPNAYGIVKRDNVQIHFWACEDQQIAQNTSCRIQVQGIDKLYEQYQLTGKIHPNALLQEKPWGSREFAVLDEDGNQITFFEF
ncbi:MAG: VOC family protein [Elainella sp. Prado103]|jgi:uncharacterized glyoxalase superfamily protein PhnB|nr:VOC family protein [Elainella sp. Prado103]